MQLNPQQQKAVDHKTGPLLIIAGAGTGKTAVITQRIVNVTKKEWAKPSEILALTFTEKAAGEMLERVDAEMPYGYEEIWISTFHSFCDRILRQEGSYIGLDSNYTLMSQAQSYVFFRQNLYDLPLDKFRPLGNPTSFISDILKHFSRLQDEDVSPEQYVEYAEKLTATTEEERQAKAEALELANTYKTYTDLKVKSSKLDFGDLIGFTLKLFRQKPNILEKYRRKFKYILVDEFQDTNFTQNVLVNILSLGTEYDQTGQVSKETVEKANLTVVGDDDQAIYKFRGAAISNILQFNKTYPNATKVVLTENYRSKQEILDASYTLITNNNPYRLEVAENIDKKLVAKGKVALETTPDDLQAVQLLASKTSAEEADKVAKEILALVGNTDDFVTEGKFNSQGQSMFLPVEEGKDVKNYEWGDIAMLVRANTHSEEFVDAFRYYGIPYKFAGPKGLYSRPEICPLISFLRLVCDYKLDIDMYNVLRMPTWQLSAREVVDIVRTARDQKLSIFEFLEDLWKVKLGSTNERLESEKISKLRSNFLSKTLSQKSIERLSDLMQIFDHAFNMVKEGESTGTILLTFFKDSGYLEELQDAEHEAQNMFMITNIGKFFETIKKYETDNKDSSVFEYVDFLDYCIEIGESPTVDQDFLEDVNAVNIMTVHGSKGLEFPVVFLVNLVSDRFPSRNRSDAIPIPEGLIKDQLPGTDEDNSHIQEERRLFYVGATRAKERLYLSAAEYYGTGKMRKKPSIFLNEILNRKVELLEEAGADAEKNGEAKKKEEHFQFPTKGVTVESLTAELSSKVKSLSEFSYTQLSAFEKCPLDYWYKYILCLPSPISGTQTFGRVIHGSLRLFYEQLKAANISLDGFATKPDLNDLLNYYEMSWYSDGFETAKQEQIRKKSGERVLKQYFEEMHKGTEQPQALEFWFRFKIDDILISGSVDRIDFLGKDKDGRDIVEIIDYKTGKVREEGAVEDDLQLSLYTIAVEQALNVKVAKASLVFVEHSKQIEANISDENKEAVRERVKRIVAEIRKGNFFAKPNYLCKFCDYRNICESAML